MCLWNLNAIASHQLTFETDWFLFYFKDYHVIFVHKSNDGRSLVYDLDCVLDFPSTFEEYFDAAIMDDANLKEKFHRFMQYLLDEILLQFPVF